MERQYTKVFHIMEMTESGTLTESKTIFPCQFDTFEKAEEHLLSIREEPYANDEYPDRVTIVPVFDFKYA